ncbi:hypothetical protein [Spirosoma sp. 209]|nr:hypothetical protein [Spirosoma sp. 209]
MRNIVKRRRCGMGMDVHRRGYEHAVPTAPGWHVELPGAANALA